MTRGPNPKFSGTTPSAETFMVLETRLRAHVTTLAGEIGERNVFNPGSLDRAAEYIAAQWSEQGYEVARQEYRVQGQRCANLEAMVHGVKHPEQIVLVGAHYDSVDGCPGANDNASGVAALLELSRHFAGQKTERTLKFVAFVNEEPPFFTTREQGSVVYAQAARARGDDIRAMISLETMGYYSDARGSQKYPPILGWFYPDVGNFIAFVSNFRSRPLLHRAVRAFRANSRFPLECASTFEGLEGVAWSDHGSFWAEGYRAFMVTDTALFRYLHYHEPTDTAERLHYDKLARVVDGLAHVVADLAKEK